MRAPLFRTLGLIVGAVAVASCSGGGEGDPESIGSSQWAVHTVCGSGDTVPGIDVSKWQGTVSWPGVKSAGKKFAIARVSHGIGTIDEQFAANWKGMKANGIIRGAYQYFDPSDDPIAQAKLFVDKIEAAGGLEDGDLPGVIDVETLSGVSSTTAVNYVGKWIDYVETHTNRKPIIYSGSYFWDDNHLGTNFKSYALWTAHYTTAACPLVSSAWAKWTFWQYSDKGTVSGITGPVDLDRFDGTMAGLQTFIENSVIVPPAGPEPGPEPEPEPGPEPGPEAGPEAQPEGAPHDTADPVEGSAQEASVLDAAPDVGTTPGRAAWAAPSDESGCACRSSGRRRGPSEAVLMLAAFGLLTALRRFRGYR